jgi:hypothetical protein
MLLSAAQIERQLVWKIGAQLRPGRSNVGTTVASQFMDGLGPAALQPRAGDEWASSGYLAWVSRSEVSVVVNNYRNYGTMPA